jgi:hypothetical protein
MRVSKLKRYSIQQFEISNCKAEAEVKKRKFMWNLIIRNLITNLQFYKQLWY